MRTALALLLILAGAGILRFVHLEAGLPQGRDPDSVIVSQALGMQRDRATGDGHISPLYPLLLAHAIDAWPGPVREAAGPGASLDEHLAKARWADLLGRRLVALLSLLALPAVWGLARRWSSPFGASVAVALLATSLVHVVFTRMARPHGPVTAFGVLAVWSLAATLRRPSWGRVLASCTLVGLGIGMLHSGVVVLLPCLLASVWLLRREGQGVLPRLLVGIAWVLVITAVSYPFLFEDGLFSSREFENPLNGAGFGRFLPRLGRADPVMLGAATLGLVLLLRRWKSGRAAAVDPGGARDAAWLCLAHALPYFLAIGMYRHTWLRFTMLLLPYLALLAALPFDGLVHAGRPRLAGIAAILALALPAWASSRYVLVQGRPDIPSQATAALLEAAQPKETVVVSAMLTLPAPQVAGTIGLLPRTLRSPWQSYQVQFRPEWPAAAWRFFPLCGKDDHQLQRSPADLLAIIAERRPRWALAYLNSRSHEVPDPTRDVLLEAGAEEVQRWMPYGPDWPLEEIQEDLEVNLLRYALRAEARGVGVGLYALQPPRRRR